MRWHELPVLNAAIGMERGGRRHGGYKLELLLTLWVNLLPNVSLVVAVPKPLLTFTREGE